MLNVHLTLTLYMCVIRAERTRTPNPADVRAASRTHIQTPYMCALYIERTPTLNPVVVRVE